MPNLYELQEQFINDLFLGTQHTKELIQTSVKLNADEHLDIYRKSIIGALQKTLKNIFPVCQKIVGKDFFLGMINEYIKKTPSLSPDIAEYGEKFPSFISNFSPIKSLVYLADVAQLEWAWHSIASAPDAPHMDFIALAKQIELNNSALQFFLPPNSFLLCSPYPILKIWEVNQENYVGDSLIKLEENTMHYYLVWRQKNDLRIEIIDFQEWQILSWFQAGFTIEKVYNEALHLFPDIHLESILPTFVKKEFLTSFKEWVSP